MDKEIILSDYVNIVKKYDEIKEAQNSLSIRLEKKITEIQYQRPTLSEAELNLKNELSREHENINAYREKLDQIKRKHRYQEVQLRKSLINDEIESKWQSTSSSHLKNIKDMLSFQ